MDLVRIIVYPHGERDALVFAADKSTDGLVFISRPQRVKEFIRKAKLTLNRLKGLCSSSSRCLHKLGCQINVLEVLNRILRKSPEEIAN